MPNPYRPSRTVSSYKHIALIRPRTHHPAPAQYDDPPPPTSGPYGLLGAVSLRGVDLAAPRGRREVGVEANPCKMIRRQPSRAEEGGRLDNALPGQHGARGRRERVPIGRVDRGRRQRVGPKT